MGPCVRPPSPCLPSACVQAASRPRIWPHCCVPSAATCPGCHHPSLGHSPPQALTLPRPSPLLHSGGGLEKHRVLLSGSHLKQAMPTTATKEVFFLEGGTASNMAWGPAPASLPLLQPHPPRHRPWPGHATPAALPSSFPPPPTAAAHPSRPNSGATLRAPKPHAQGTRAPCYLPPSTSHSGGVQSLTGPFRGLGSTAVGSVRRSHTRSHRAQAGCLLTWPPP